MPDDHEPITLLIRAARDGGQAERDHLFRTVYEELRLMAQSMRHVGHDGQTLQATVLANETFLELQRRFPLPPERIPESRATFFRTVALAMRTILRDYWRARTALKRGGGSRPARLADADLAATPEIDEDAEAFIALDEALSRLQAHNERWYDVAMQRFFGGRTIPETARILEISESTVQADWRQARAWLRTAMEEGEDNRGRA
ncbi:MAG: sigma-70 family RNA polymerase sigma factor [Phycisphaerales bacterium]|nr:sigma-70 family RNA polymerase sigma factor [Phycisphaerales bacterium]